MSKRKKNTKTCSNRQSLKEGNKEQKAAVSKSKNIEKHVKKRNKILLECLGRTAADLGVSVKLLCRWELPRTIL
jgi:hypothetical protein